MEKMISPARLTTVLLLAMFTLGACSSTDTPSSNSDTKYRVSGRITSTPTSPATQNVTVTMGSRSAMTDTNSAFVFDSVSAGAYVLLPSLAGRTFTPTSKSITVSNTDITNVDFDLDPSSSIGPDSIQLVLIQPGTFMMGNDSGVPEFNLSSIYKHQVTITYPFYVGKYEVTQAQWNRVIAENPSLVVGDNLPVAGVHSDSIIVFCNRMSVLHGLQPVYTGFGKGVSINYSANGYRLLTEAEWEYSASAGDTSLFYDVEDPEAVVTPADSARINAKTGEYAWWANNLGGRLAAKPQPVGTRKPNAWGLYDMIGNIYEIVEDNHDYYKPEPVLDPVIIPVTQYRVIRGGSYGYEEWKFLTLRKRMSGEWNKNYSYVGFRIARK